MQIINGDCDGTCVMKWSNNQNVCKKCWFSNFEVPGKDRYRKKLFFIFMVCSYK